MTTPSIPKLLLLLPLAVLPACVRIDPPPPPSDTPYVIVKGVGTIVEIHAELNYVMLKTDDGTIKAWWNEYYKFFAGPAQVQNLSLRPGDHVTYLGVRAFNEIYVHQLTLHP